MHILPVDRQAARNGNTAAVSSSLAAFMCAVGGLGVTSSVVSDHQLPEQPEDVVTYLATLGAAVITGWWLANVLAWVAALRRGLDINRFTLPGTKRIAQVMLAATITTSCVGGSSNDPVMVLVEQAERLESTTTTDQTALPSTTLTSATSTTPATSPSTIPPTTAPPANPVPDPVEVENHDDDAGDVSSGPTAIENHLVVAQQGDNLWALASETLTAAGIARPSSSQVAEYWRLVLASNEVRSGNPDLIAVGEPITMPAFDLSTFDVDVRPVQQSQPSGISPI